jgi:hypothetical protein
MRNYHLSPDFIRYAKQRTYKNHSKVHTTENTYGSFDCKSKWVKRFLGWLWVRLGIRVLR